MSALRDRMIEDMRLAGLAEETQRAYIRAVRQLTTHYRKPPDQLSEEEVRSYLLALIDQRVARGTFKSTRFGVQFFYQQTFGLKWDCLRSGSASQGRSDCLRCCQTMRSVVCSAVSGIRCTGPAWQ